MFCLMFCAYFSFEIHFGWLFYLIKILPAGVNERPHPSNLSMPMESTINNSFGASESFQSGELV